MCFSRHDPTTIDWSRTSAGTSYQCWNSAIFNLLHNDAHTPEKRHRLMAGSLKLKIMKKGSNGAFKPLTWTYWGDAEEAGDRALRDDPSNAHCWIEDADGRIWDWLPPELNNQKPTEEGYIRFKPEGLHINGLTRAEIQKRYSLYYITNPNKKERDITTMTILHHAFRFDLPYKPRTTTRWAEPGKLTGMGYFYLGFKERNYIAHASILRRQKEALDMLLFLTKMNLEGLVTGDKDTLTKWRLFYNDPFTYEPDIAPIIKIHSTQNNTNCSRLPLDPAHEQSLALLDRGEIEPALEQLCEKLARELDDD